MGNIWLQDCKEYEPKLLKSLNLILLLSASVTKVSDTNTQGSLHQRDPILIADIRVSLVQGSMLLQLNVVIAAFLINIDKEEPGIDFMPPILLEINIDIDINNPSVPELK